MISTVPARDRSLFSVGIQQKTPANKALWLFTEDFILPTAINASRVYKEDQSAVFLYTRQIADFLCSLYWWKYFEVADFLCVCFLN